MINKNTNNQTLKAIICSLSALSTNVIAADLDMDQILEMSLKELMDIRISIASDENNAQNIKQSPAIVSVITREEILNSGAQDFYDVMRLVPGFVVASDFQGTIGFAHRGLWAAEGKILLQVDGVNMNEHLYGNTLLGSFSFVEHIKRIEIIRGPGSVVHGGFAEYSVINIVTLGHENNAPSFVSTTYSDIGDTYGHKNITGTFSTQHNKDINLSMNFGLSDGHRSDGIFTEGTNEDYDLSDLGQLEANYFNISLNFNDLDVRFIHDEYIVDSTISDPITSGNALPLHTNFRNNTVEVKYNKNISNNFEIIPKLTYSQQTPWRTDDAYAKNPPTNVPDNWYFRMDTERIKGELLALYSLSNSLNLTAGIERYYDKVTTPADVQSWAKFANGETETSYSNNAAHLQMYFKSNQVDVTLGARIENHSFSGSSFVPRLGLYKHLDDAYIKLLIARSFRAPTVDNIRANSTLKPETTTNYEIQYGYQHDDHFYLTANVFSTRIKNLIAYEEDLSKNVGYIYINAQEKVGTDGLESEIKWRGEWGYISFAYAYYHASKLSTYDNSGTLEFLLPSYGARDEAGLIIDDHFFGMPAHSASLNTSFRLNSNNLSINPSLIYESKRYAGDIDKSDGSIKSKVFGDVLLFNLFLRSQHFMKKNIEIGVGVYNVFDENYRLPTGYNLDDVSLPMAGRELVFRFKYEF